MVLLTFLIIFLALSLVVSVIGTIIMTNFGRRVEFTRSSASSTSIEPFAEATTEVPAADASPPLPNGWHNYLPLRRIRISWKDNGTAIVLFLLEIGRVIDESDFPAVMVSIGIPKSDNTEWIEWYKYAGIGKSPACLRYRGDIFKTWSSDVAQSTLVAWILVRGFNELQRRSQDTSQQISPAIMSEEIAPFIKLVLDTDPVLASTTHPSMFFRFVSGPLQIIMYSLFILLLLVAYLKVRRIQNVMNQYRAADLGLTREQIAGRLSRLDYLFGPLLTSLPAFGFIGTLWGLSRTILGLGSDAGGISLQKSAQLSDVTSSLAFCFDTTLIGLILSLIAAVILGHVSSFGSRVYNLLLNQLEANDGT